MAAPIETLQVQRLIPAFMVIGLVVLIVKVMAPFMAPMVWAGILAHISWPVFRRVQAWTGGRRNIDSLAMMAILILATVLPTLAIAMLVQDEVASAYHAASDLVDHGAAGLAEAVAHIPWFGLRLHDWMTQHITGPEDLKQLVGQWLGQGSRQIVGVLGGIGKGGAGFAIILMTLFFCFRDGESALLQVKLALNSLIGAHFETYLSTASELSRAIVLSAGVSALAQGAIAALGYWIIGVNAPAILGVITGAATIVPFFGTLAVWGSVSAYLLLTGHSWQALAMVAWGTVLIHPADNLIRPLLISNAIHVPFLLVFFGVLGGMAAFGLVGVLLGPMILAVGIAAWNEWVSSITAASAKPEGE